MQFTMTDNDFDIKYYSLEDFFDTFMFKTWKARGTCISCEDMRETLNLDEILDSNDPSFEDTISFCEAVAECVDEKLAYQIVNTTITH